MKNKVSKPAKALFTIGAIIAIVSATISFKSCKGCDEDYITVSGTVYARYDNPEKEYKSRKVTSEFILVVKMDNGHVFDIEVTPSTFATHPEGSRITFTKVYPSDIYLEVRREYMDNQDRAVGSMMIFWVGLIIFCIGGLKYSRDNSDN